MIINVLVKLIGNISDLLEALVVYEAGVLGVMMQLQFCALGVEQSMFVPGTIQGFARVHTDTSDTAETGAHRCHLVKHTLSSGTLSSEKMKISSGDSRGFRVIQGIF